MTPPTLRAIPCSERMPTREDADEHGWVVWLAENAHGEVSVDHFMGKPLWAVYFFPLNRSAIVTEEPKEQRTKKHDGPCWRQSHSDCGC